MSHEPVAIRFLMVIRPFRGLALNLDFGNTWLVSCWLLCDISMHSCTSLFSPSATQHMSSARNLHALIEFTMHCTPLSLLSGLHLYIYIYIYIYLYIYKRHVCPGLYNKDMEGRAGGDGAGEGGMGGDRKV